MKHGKYVVLNYLVKRGKQLWKQRQKRISLNKWTHGTNNECEKKGYKTLAKQIIGNEDL